MSTRLTVARRITDTFDPKNTITAVSVLIGCGLYGFKGLGWAAISVVFAAVLPITYIVYVVKDGNWAERHMTERQQRMSVFPVIMGSVAVGLVLLALTGAPRPLMAMTAAMFATITAIWPITRYWKISVHTAVAAGALLMLAQALSPWWLLGFGGVVVLGWSRTALGDHTLAQTVAGTILGSIIAGGVYAAF